MAEVLSELVAKITTDATGLKSGLTSADKSIGSFVTKNAAGLRSLGVAFTAMGAAVVGGLGASTKAAVDFETAFTGVRKTVEATDAEFSVLRQGIRDLAKVLPLPAVEIAGIAQAAGQLGVKTPDIMKFTEVIAKLGMATDLTSQDAAVLLAKFTNVMRMDISNMDRLAAVIVDLGNNMATNEPEIVAMASRLSGAAAVVGMTEANVIALAAALSSLGVEAQMGGTAVQRVLLEMNTAVIGGGEELKGFADIAGMTTSEFARAFKEDAASALITFVTGLKSAMDSGQDVTSMLEDLGLADMRVLQVLLKSAGGLDRLTEAQLISNTAWEEKIALDVEVAKRLEDTASKMAILKNVLVDVGITVGDFFVPLLKGLVDKLMPIIKSVQTWIEENPNLAKTIAITAGVVGLLSLALGGLLILLPGLIAAVTTFGITTSIALGGIPIAIGLVVAGVTWLVLNWEKSWNWVKEITTIVARAILSAFQSIVEGISWAMHQIANIVSVFAPQWAESIRSAANSMTQAISDFRTNAVESLTGFDTKVEETVEVVEQGAKDITTATEEMVVKQDAALEKGKESFARYSTAFKTFTDSLLHNLRSAVGVGSGMAESLMAGQRYAYGSEQEFQEALAGMGNIYTGTGWITPQHTPQQYQQALETHGTPEESIKGYASGGLVPSTGLAYLHAGETVIPANEPMGSVTVNISGPLFMEREDQMNQLVDKIRKGIQRQDRLRFGGAYNG